jgi:menaquinol-cytochrome c reductase iron-sulfur subunit
MAPRSLNPNASDNISKRLAGDNTPQPQRRGILVGILAGAVGLLVGIFPLGAGLLTFLDPILKKKPGEEADASEPGQWIRVGLLENIPADGTPVQAPVIADLTDAWNREPNQPIGAVYLRREGDKVIAFNAICPHAGCFVGFDGKRDCFVCPCHTSAFNLDGTIQPPSPSPRNMDDLVVDDEKLAASGEVWVRFVNYYPGKADREPKA